MSVEQIQLFKAFAIILGLAVAGYGYIRGHLKQRRAKSKKLLAFFHDKVSSSDIEQWGKILQASNQASGAKSGHFIVKKHKQLQLVTLLQNNAHDKGCTANITAQIEFVCSQILTDKYDLPAIVLEIGQLMIVTYDWFKNDASFKENYPNFVKVMTEKNISSFPSTTIVNLS